VRTIATAAILALALAAPAHAVLSPGLETFEPRDECRSDPEAAAFLDALAEASETRDAAAFAALASEDVALDFGGGAGKEELLARLDGGEEIYGDLWKEIAVLLGLGCSLDGGYITIPWYFAQDFGDLDPFGTMLTIRPDVQVRSAPASTAEVVETLGWEAVNVTADYDPEAQFTEIHRDGRPGGYVETSALRSLIDYRILAERGEEGWRITAFVAGD
jgi:hypothetical protein